MHIAVMLAQASNCAVMRCHEPVYLSMREAFRLQCKWLASRSASSQPSRLGCVLNKQMHCNHNVSYGVKFLEMHGASQLNALAILPDCNKEDCVAEAEPVN